MARTRTPPPGLAPYVTVAILAAIPLLVLSAAAPGGSSYHYLELPRPSTVLALASFVTVVSLARDGNTAFAVPIITVGATLVWLLATNRGYRTEALVNDTLQTLAPWLVGALYGVLAFLAVKRSATPHLNRRRAGAWLVLVGIIAIVLTLENASWLTLENLSKPGTYRSSSAWPDTKEISLVAAIASTVIGLLITIRGRSALPRAIVRR